MKDQDCSEATVGQLMAEDTALHLFQIAALMLGDEQEAVSLVEESVAKVETDPCAQGPQAYDEARTLLVHTAVQRMAGLYPEAFAVPTAQPNDGCIDAELGAAELTGEQIGAMVSGAGMREWLGRLGARAAGDFCAPRGRRTGWRTDGGESSPERSARSPGMAARPGWHRLSPGAVLAGYLPDECANHPRAGLNSSKSQNRSASLVFRLTGSFETAGIPLFE